MNFKEIYKSANDDIHADKALLYNIIEKSENTRKMHFKMQYVYMAASLAAVIAVSFFLKMQPAQKSQMQILKNTEYSSDKNEIFSETEVVSPKTSADKAANTDKQILSKSVGIKDNNDVLPSVNSAEGSVKTEDTLTEISDAEDIKTENEVAYDNSVKINDKSPYERSLSGSSARVTFFADDGTCREEIGYNDYCDYIGIDITAKAKLPVGMSFSENESVVFTKEDDKTVDDKAYFSAFDSNGEKYVQLITSKIYDDAEVYLQNNNYEKSIFNGVSAVVIQNQTVYEAYFMYNGTSISVCTNSFSESELTDLLISLTK